MKSEKSQIRVSIPDYILNQLDITYKDRRLYNRSELIIEYCKSGLSHEDSLSLPLKLAYQKDVISTKLDGLLSTLNIESTGSLLQKFDVAFASYSTFGVSNGVRTAKNSYDVVIFELLEDLKYIDTEEYRRVMVEFTKYVTLKGKYKKYIQILSGQSTL